jgi:hypothetical protein
VIANRRSVAAWRAGMAWSNGGFPPVPKSTVAIWNVGFTSTAAGESFAANIVRRVELTGSKPLPGRSGCGAILPYRLWQLRHGLRAFPGGPL